MAQTVYTAIASEKTRQNLLVVIPLRSSPTFYPALENFDCNRNLAFSEGVETSFENDMVSAINNVRAE